jgi:hypothetical protein
MFEWTYVSTARYFAFPSLFIQIVAFYWLFINQHSGRIFLHSILKTLLLAIFTIELLHGLYFVVKKISSPISPFYRVITEDAKKGDVINLIQQQSLKDPSRLIVVTSFSPLPGFIAAWHGAIGMPNPQLLNTTLPKSSKPAVLFVVVHKKEVFLLAPFLKRSAVELIRKTEDYCYYRYYVEPSN